MNIEDVNQKIKIPENPIIAIFDLQKELMKKYDQIEKINGFNIPEPPYNLDDSKVQARIKDMFWRTTEELAEAMETTPPFFQLTDWKKFWETDFCIRHFFEELADALHFLVEASIIAELNPETEVAVLFEIVSLLDIDISDLNLKILVSNVILSMGLAANILKNKPWKQTQMCTDVQKFKNKLIVVWVDFITLWQGLNCSQEDIYILYIKKHTVNVWRQDTNY